MRQISALIVLFLLSKDALANSSPNEYARCAEAASVLADVFCLPQDYSKHVAPIMDGPIRVHVKLPVWEISNIDDQHSQWSLRVTYKVLWPEPRLRLNLSRFSNGETTLPGSLVSNFWTPDLIVHDLVSFVKPEVLNDVAALEIKSDKRLYYKVRSDLTLVCPGMQFSRFPLDTHICRVKFTSFGHSMPSLLLDGQFDYRPQEGQRALPFVVQLRDLPESQRVHIGASHNYSVYGLEVRMRRVVAPYILNTYLPTAVFVVMSWLSFLIPTDVVPARVVLLVTLCLVIINTFNNVTKRIPVAGSVTALEVWLLACILLVFGALLEYALILKRVHDVSRRRGKAIVMRMASPTIKEAHEEHQEDVIDVSQPIASTEDDATKQRPILRYQENIDRKALIFFPLVFFIFNVVYWTHFIIAAQEDEE